MRVSARLIALIVVAPAVAAAAPQEGAKPAPPSAQAPVAACPKTTSHVATEKAPFNGQKLAPHKLTDLPSATTYMAVYRRIAGCEVPLTMVEYRNPRRR